MDKLGEVWKAVTSLPSTHQAGLAFVVLVLVLSVPRIPQPERPAETAPKKAFYLWRLKWIAWQVAVRVSLLAWNKFGGELKLPGTISPKPDGIANCSRCGVPLVPPETGLCDACVTQRRLELDVGALPPPRPPHVTLGHIEPPPSVPTGRYEYSSLHEDVVPSRPDQDRKA